jgi:amino acid adenylation domain-containing protein
MKELSSLTEFSAEQLKLLAEQLAEEGIELSDKQVISRRPANSEPQLSFAQQRLWLLDQLEAGSPAYNIALALNLRGSLNVTALGRALSEVVCRHEALRTSFRTVQGQPIPVIAEPQQLPLTVIDISHLSPEQQAQEAQHIIEQEAQTPFDLSCTPLLRASLVRHGEQEHKLLLTMHHIISDGWSMAILWREVGVLYEAYSDGAESPLEPLPIQYADYALWQREWLKGEVLQEQLRYWKQQLADAPPLIELPLDRPRPAALGDHGTLYHFGLSQKTSESLTHLSQKAGVTINMTVLAAFVVLLRRLSGQEELVVGTPVAGRNRKEVEGLIGFFVNTLALRFDTSGDPSFLELIGRVRKVCLGGYERQDLPFEKLVEELAPERTLSHSPIFQVFFNMLNFEEGKVRLGDVEVDFLSPPVTKSKFDWTLYVKESHKRIIFSLLYNTDLFERSSIAGMMDQFLVLLSEIAAEPHKKISEFSLLTEKTERLLPNPRQPIHPDWKGSVQKLFAEQAHRIPNHPALKDKEESWTYQELAAHSNQLAHYLRASGIRHQDVVAIYAHRSASLVWAVMGVLKAGAAFLILDPAYPDSRLIQYLSVARPRGWLQLEAAGTLSAPLEEMVASLSCCCRLQLPSRTNAATRQLLSDYPADEPHLESGPEDVACVTFTSGSTGKPKGVLGTHRSLSHYGQWIQQNFQIDDSDRFTMLSGLAHDPLQRDIFTPLQLGATLCIPDPDEIGTPGWVAQWMRHEQISVTNLTPAMCQLMTQTVAETKPLPIDSLRYAFFIGDFLTRGDVARLQALAPSVTCINLYGTTETQRALAYHVVTDEHMAHANSEREVLSLGRGIDEVQLLILNASGQLAGVGEIGEIHCRSPHLAKGYLGDDELTRERFISNPFTNIDGDRLYRTGDVGRYQPDGNIEWLGRADKQVKIRGFRIELGEIEAALKEHEGVFEAVVIARDDIANEKRLVAYVVAEADQRPAISELRRGLKEKFPDYMVPSSFVLLKELPLTPNGKVDRQALPVPDQSRATIEEEYVAASSPVEEVIAGILSELLHVEKVGLHDNFFELGGHSLLAMQVVARIQKALRVNVPLRNVFDTPTVAGLAELIERQMLSTENGSGPPLVHVPRAGKVPFSFNQEARLLREWRLRMERVSIPPAHTYAAYRFTGPLDIAALEFALNEIVRRHEVLRTTFPALKGMMSSKVFSMILKKVLTMRGAIGKIQRLSKKSYFSARLFGQVQPTVMLKVPVIDLRHLAPAQREAEAQRICIQELHRPFDTVNGPMLRTTLMRTGDEEYVLNLLIHHFVADGWSLAVFMRELMTLYLASTRGEPSSLPELGIQYADFAEWQRQSLQGEALEKLVSYWKDHLSGSGFIPELVLPFARPIPDAPSYKGTFQTITVNAELHQAVKTLSNKRSVTIFMTLLAALKTLLHLYNGREHIGVITPIANRVRPEIQQLIGLIANFHTTSTSLAGDPPFTELLDRVRQTTLGAYAHQEIPLPLLFMSLLPYFEDKMPRDIYRIPNISFQVIYERKNWQPVPELSIARIKIPFHNPQPGSIAVVIVEEDGELKVNFKYPTEAFDDWRIQEMLTNFLRLLEGIVADPEARLSELPFATQVAKPAMRATAR